MNIPWKPIFQYRLSKKANAQAVYEKLFFVALKHKFRNLRHFAVPINNKTLTEAIFDLNTHDKLKISNKMINGQKIKELFVATIFLRRLETKYAEGTIFFIAIPETENSCDVAVFTSKSNPHLISKEKFKLPKNHDAFLFQIKEYLNFEKLENEENLLTVESLDKDKIIRIAGNKNYSESILVFMRDFINYKSTEMKDFFENNPNCYLISVPQDIIKDGKKIPLDPNKHNYIISFPHETFSIESFDRPSFLLSSGQIAKLIR